MRLSGEFTVETPLETAFKYLTDPRFITDHLPDLSAVEIFGDRSFDVVLKVGISHIRGAFSAHCTIEEFADDHRARFVVVGSGVASKVRLEITFELTSSQSSGATLVTWHGEATVAGRLASIGGGLLEPIVQQKTAEFVTSIKQGVEAEERGPYLEPSAGALAAGVLAEPSPSSALEPQPGCSTRWKGLLMLVCGAALAAASIATLGRGRTRFRGRQRSEAAGGNRTASGRVSSSRSSAA